MHRRRDSDSRRRIKYIARKTMRRKEKEKVRSRMGWG